MEGQVDLNELERRVGEKWIAAASARIPQDPFDVSQWSAFNISDWTPTYLPPLMQFPRERWVSYPAKRTVALMACEALLDRAGELSDEHWMTVCLMMQYGGKTRIA